MNTTPQQIATTTMREPIDLDAMLDEANRAMQRVSAAGQDTRALKAHEKENILAGLAKALGLNPLSNPVRFLPMQGGEVLYVTRQGTDQIAARLRLNRETTMGPEVRTIDGHKVVFCQVRVTAPAPDGRSEMATATLPLKDITNDLMKCETKAKRRATLSLAGLGLLTEEETETIPGARVEAPRDDAPAQLAAPDALAAFRADLDAAEGLTLDSARSIYAAHDLGGTSLSAVTVALVGALATRGYRLTATEAGQLLRGEMPDALALAYDRLAAVDRHPDDEDGDGVVADVVRVLRGAGSLPKAAKSRLLKVAAQTAAALLSLDDATAAARLDAALRPPTPPAPTGTDAPRAAAPSAEGGSVAPSQTAGAQASASDGPRYVADTDAAHVQVAGTWRESEAGWREHLGEMTVRRRVEASVGCNGALLGPRFLAMAAQRIVELDAAKPLPAGVARLTVIGVTQTLERVALDASRARAAQGQRAA